MSETPIPPATIRDPSSSPVIGSKTFWAVVGALVLMLPEIVQEVAGLNILPPAWIEKMTAFATVAVGIAVLYSRLAAKLAAELGDAKTAAVAGAAQAETPTSAQTLDAVRDSVEGTP